MKKKLFLVGGAGIDAYNRLRKEITPEFEIFMIDSEIPILNLYKRDNNVVTIPIEEYWKSGNVVHSNISAYGHGCMGFTDEAKRIVDGSPETMKRIKNLMLNSDRNLIVFGAGGGFGGTCALRMLEDTISEDICSKTSFLIFYPERHEHQRRIENANFVLSKFTEVKEKVDFEVVDLENYIRSRYAKKFKLPNPLDKDVTAKICEIFEL